METATTAPRMTLGHMGLGCFDQARMVDFYTRVLGFTVTDRSRLAVFMTTDPIEHHQIALVPGRTEGSIATGPVPGGSLGTSIFQVSFRVRDLTALRDLKKRLEDYGITHFDLRNHGNAWAIYFRDPEGNAVELYVPTPWHAAQPCGIPHDLDQTDAEIYAFTERYCQSQPDYKPYDQWRADMAVTLASKEHAAA